MEKYVLIRLKKLLKNKKIYKESISFILVLNLLISLGTKSNGELPLDYRIKDNSKFCSLLENIVTISFNENPDRISVNYMENLELSHAFTNEEKVIRICKKYKITEEEFRILAAVVMAECKRNNYTDAYAVINTIFNRMISYRWLNSVTGNLNIEDEDATIYHQVINPNQFETYSNGNYKEFLDVKEGNAYQAIIDFLFDGEVMHDYLYFVSADNKDSYREQFVEGGNNYSGTLKEEDTIPEEERYFNIKEEQKYTLHVS